MPLVLTLIYTVVTPVSTLMAWRYVTGQPVVREVIRLADVAPILPASVVASEDGQFCRHWGVDWREFWAVMTEAEGPSRGASTLSMQVARNLFLWQGDSGPTAALRKILELPMAVMIDLVWSKRRMMEIYLNIAEWGADGEFGVAAGARAAFGKPPSRLSPREAALLVAMLPNPRERDASDPTSRMARVAAIVERRARVVDVACLGLSRDR